MNAQIPIISNKNIQKKTIQILEECNNISDIQSL